MVWWEERGRMYQCMGAIRMATRRVRGSIVRVEVGIVGGTMMVKVEEGSR